MDKKWLSLRRTLQLAAGGSSMTRQAKLMICRRATSGLIQARAKLFKTRTKQFDNYDVPKTFWRVLGEDALMQNWDTGDFDIWFRGKIHWRAYGIEFHHLDVQSAVGLDTDPRRPWRG